ncbi:MlaD family protein [Candidatus Latescibacterota bacterium]
MATRAQKVRLSIFLIASSTILLIFFLVLVGSRIFKRMDPYYIVYEGISVTGLEPGAAVKFQGVQVGRVADLSLIDAASIRVDIQVDHGIPIKTNTEATVNAVGITGLKYIELLSGTTDADPLPIGASIMPGQSLLDNITGRAEVIMVKLEQVLNNLNVMLSPETTQSIQSALNSIASVSQQLDVMLTENRQSLTRSVANLDTVMHHLASTSESAAHAAAAINELVKSDDVQGTVADVRTITAQLKTEIDSLHMVETSKELRTLLTNANQMVVHYDMIGLRARDDILQSLRNLEEALDNLRVATDVIRENPSVLLRGRQTTGDRVE